MRALGIDLGSKRIGIAVSDRSGTIASPLTVLQRSGSVRRDHQAIAALVVEEEAELLVVGLPLNMNGTMGPAAKAAVTEAEALATVVGVPVISIGMLGRYDATNVRGFNAVTGDFSRGALGYWIEGGDGTYTMVEKK